MEVLGQVLLGRVLGQKQEFQDEDTNAKMAKSVVMSYESWGIFTAISTKALIAASLSSCYWP